MVSAIRPQMKGVSTFQRSSVVEPSPVRMIARACSTVRASKSSGC